jgi:GTPase KRas protein
LVHNWWVIFVPYGIYCIRRRGEARSEESGHNKKKTVKRNRHTSDGRAIPTSAVKKYRATSTPPPIRILLVSKKSQHYSLQFGESFEKFYLTPPILGRIKTPRYCEPPGSCICEMDNPQKVSITICGDGGCGKSSITLRLVRSQWTHEYDPTIEDSYSLTRRIDGQTYYLSLTDTAGQEEYRGMWASSNLRSDAFLLVYDITNPSSLDVLQEFNELIDMEAETRIDVWENRRDPKSKKKGSKETAPVQPIKIVAGNKCDLQESRQVPAREGLEWARKRGCGFMETSARNTVNIEETFALIVRRVVEARRIANGGAPSGTGLDGNGMTEKARRSLLSLGRHGSTEALGTRRAMTAPLSPLPGGPEKRLEPENTEGGQGKRSRFKTAFRKLACW